MLDEFFGLEKNHKICDGDEIEHLTTVYDVVMLGMIRGLLEDENIPYLVRERGTGSAMRIITGFSLYGTDIFVPKDAYATARDLIAGLENAEAVEFVEDDVALDETNTSDEEA